MGKSEADQGTSRAVAVAVALVAVGLGLLIGTLAAPASGQETRRRWRRRVEDEVESLRRRGRDSVDGVVQQGAEFASSRLKQGKETLAELVRD